jgi:hypothetical protein
MNTSIGYIVGPVRLSVTSKPVMRDGGSFYSLTFRGTTALGEPFSFGVYSEKPIEIQEGVENTAQCRLPWDDPDRFA